VEAAAVEAVEAVEAAAVEAVEAAAPFPAAARPTPALRARGQGSDT
jgi:hypothetical protein